MNKNSSNSEGKKIREEEFAKIGEAEKVKSEPKPPPETRNIFFDGRQYICKFPKNIMNEVKFQEGDKLKFTLEYPKDTLGKPKLKIEYIKAK